MHGAGECIVHILYPLFIRQRHHEIDGAEIFRSEPEELNDCLCGDLHVRRFLEPVVGSLDGDELDDILVRELPCGFKRNDLVRSAVENEKVVGIVEKAQLLNVGVLQVRKKLRIHVDLPVKAHGNGLALAKLVIFVALHDRVDQDLIHIDRRTAQCDFPERVPMLCEIGQYQISAEARRIGIDLLYPERAADVVEDDVQIIQTVAQDELFLHIIAVTGPVKDEHGSIRVFTEHSSGEFLGSAVVLMTGKTVAEENDLLQFFRLIHIELAADIVPVAVDLKVF